eukprot:360897-Chlamydomonas_euryale.AAC.2
MASPGVGYDHPGRLVAALAPAATAGQLGEHNALPVSPSAPVHTAHTCSSCPSAVDHTRTSVPFSLAVASRRPSSDSARHDSGLLCALMNLVWRRSYSSRRTCRVVWRVRRVWIKRSTPPRRPMLSLGAWQGILEGVHLPVDARMRINVAGACC